jgi:hypothetical protein
LEGRLYDLLIGAGLSPVITPFRISPSGRQDISKVEYRSDASFFACDEILEN